MPRNLAFITADLDPNSVLTWQRVSVKRILIPVSRDCDANARSFVEIFPKGEPDGVRLYSGDWFDFLDTGGTRPEVTS